MPCATSLPVRVAARSVHMKGKSCIVFSSSSMFQVTIFGNSSKLTRKCLPERRVFGNIARQRNVRQTTALRRYQNIDCVADTAKLSQQVQCARQVKVISFDLDDTLWPTTGVVLGANAILESWLAENHPNMECKSSSFQTTMKEIRKECLDTIPGWVVKYKKLRTDALTRLAREGGYEDAEGIGRAGFDVWLQARQDSANRLLFADAVSTLQALKDAGYLIGGITNGNGDPRQVKQLAPLFDFYVSAEEPEVGVPKPSPKPFQVAMQRAALLMSINHEAVSELASAWVHVGDCVENDVKAANEMGMRSVWYSPEEGEGEYMSWRSLREKAGGDDSNAIAMLCTKDDSSPQIIGVETPYEDDEDLSDAKIVSLAELVPIIAEWNNMEHS